MNPATPVKPVRQHADFPELVVMEDGNAFAEVWVFNQTKEYDYAQARRLVAAWNATATLPVEDLEAGIVEKMIAICRQIVTQWDEGFSMSEMNDLLIRCSSVLAKVLPAS